MTPDYTAPVAQLLKATAGGYLRTIIREPRVTCAVCATPVGRGFPDCFQCGQHAKIAGIADLVVPLSYAVANEQSGTTMRHYKDDPSAPVRDSLAPTVARLLYLGIVLHESCVARSVGSPIARRLVVPSNRSRNGEHPFVSIAQGIGVVDRLPALAPGPGAGTARTVSSARFAVTPAGTRFDGQHVMILDDTWTTGASAQSAALVARGLGAARVSVMTVARWIDPSWRDNQAFVKRLSTTDFDPYRCPVTGGVCPPARPGVQS